MLDSNRRNGRTIFAPLIFAFTYLPAKIMKIKGARKFRGLQYAQSRFSELAVATSEAGFREHPVEVVQRGKSDV